MIDDVAAHIAHRARAEVAPAAPIVRRVGGMVGTLVNGTQPEIPVERPRHWRRLLRPADPLFPQQARAVGPTVDLANFADHAGLNPFIGQPRPLGGVPLIAHLRHHARVMRGLRQRAALVERMREGLLAIHMLARPNGGHRGEGMNMIGRADRDGIDVRRLLVEQAAKILVSPRLGKRAKRSGRPHVVNVAQRDDIGPIPRMRCNIAAPHAPGTDSGEIHRARSEQDTPRPRARAAEQS